ncbi:hypothetical protein GGX14DRAFT_465814 [Mycena pura]|uniref:Uncharacterized protein n=1 Tax=Mycena pura TaxID=153505 RepID=A0AAD6Y605_9AGAR|nr:hypothetical protein GGX14DRAFT_465814 [Mycena pura]
MSKISRRSCALAALLVLAPHVLAAPAAPRDGPALTNQTVQDWMTSALDVFLAAWNAETSAFNVNGPWSTVDFAGDASNSLTEDEINNKIFSTCDTQNFRLTNKVVGFSNLYADFVRELEQNIPTPRPSEKMNQTAQQMLTDCYTTVPNAREAALQIYSKIAPVPPTNASDPKFLQWAEVGDPDYSNALSSCEQSTIANSAATSENYGDDSGLYVAAAANIAPLEHDDEQFTGINMPIAAGSFVPYYSIPTLNVTLTAWQNGVGLSPVSFSSSNSQGSTSSSTKFGGAHLGITYEEIGVSASASHSEAKSSSEVNALGFSLSFQGLALLEIEQGVWFDGYRVARAAENPDSKHLNATKVFSNATFFGSQDQPGPLSVYNAQALVGFKPSWSIQFENFSTADSSSATQASADLSIFGLIDIGGYGGSTDNKTTFDTAASTLTIEDDSNNAYIIGFVQSSYYTWS